MHAGGVLEEQLALNTGLETLDAGTHLFLHAGIETIRVGEFGLEHVVVLAELLDRKPIRYELKRA